MSEFKLIEEVIRKSVSSNWQEAKTEWYYNNEWFEHQQNCICGHKNILQVCVIHNRKNSERLEVGNCCVQKFIPDCDSTKGFNALKKTKKDVRSRIKKDVLDSSLVKSKISEEKDIEKYDDIFKDKDILESDYEYVENINRKFLKRHIVDYKDEDYTSEIKGIIPKEMTIYRDSLKRKLLDLTNGNKSILNMHDILLLNNRKLIGEWELSFYTSILGYKYHSEKQVAIINKINNIYLKEFSNKVFTEEECSLILTGLTEKQRQDKRLKDLKDETLRKISEMNEEREANIRNIELIDKKILKLQSILKQE